MWVRFTPAVERVMRGGGLMSGQRVGHASSAADASDSPAGISAAIRRRYNNYCRIRLQRLLGQALSMDSSCRSVGRV